MTRTARARALVFAALQRYRAESAPWVSNDALLRLISRQEYPWGERRYWPYKAWLIGVRDVRHFMHTGSWPERVRPRPLPLEQLALDLER